MDYKRMLPLVLAFRLVLLVEGFEPRLQGTPTPG